jgi:hypothetical protein
LCAITWTFFAAMQPAIVIVVTFVRTDRMSGSPLPEADLGNGQTTMMAMGDRVASPTREGDRRQ